MIYQIKKKFYLVVSIFVFSLIISSLHVLVAGTNYIATTGSDTTDGTITSPWLTIEHALSHTEPGDTIMVREGTYFEEEIWIRGNFGGEPGQVKTIMAYPGEEAILSDERIIIHVSYVRIQGFIINQKPLHITGDHIEILDNHIITLSGIAALNFYGGICSNNLINGNVFDTNGNLSSLQYSIYLDGGAHNVISNNIISGFTENGIYIYDQYMTTSDILIENNYIKESKLRSGIAIGASDRSRIDDVKIRNNVLEDNAEFGVELYGRVHDVKIYNNTFIQASLDSIPYVWGNDRCGIYISEDPENVEVKNNIFYNKDSLGTHINMRDGADALSISHNLYWPTSPKLLTVGENWENIIGEFNDENPIIGDPMFVNVDSSDYHLQYDSPAINTGIDVGLEYLGPVPDLGAFETIYTSVETNSENAHLQFNLKQNYPNPFNPSTEIIYSLPKNSYVNLTVYNMRGQKVITLVDGVQKSGINYAKWLGQDFNGINVTSGLYIYIMKTDNFVSTKKMMLLR